MIEHNHGLITMWTYSMPPALAAGRTTANSDGRLGHLEGSASNNSIWVYAHSYANYFGKFHQ